MTDATMQAYNAGIHPFGSVPYALELLRQHGLATWESRSEKLEGIHYAQ